MTDTIETTLLPEQDFKESSALQELNSWEDLDAKVPLLRGIYAYGFETPSPIQKKAILPIFNKRDVIAQAQSGTGKTACFTIGALQLIDVTKRTTQAILLSPTRELAIQTKLVVENIGNMFNELRTQLLIGGTSVDEDIHQLHSNTPHIVIGWMKCCLLDLKTRFIIFFNLCHLQYRLRFLVQLFRMSYIN